MANEIALGLVIGGAVSASLGKAIGETKARVTELQKKTQTAKLWQNTIGEAQRLQREYQTLFKQGSAAADGVRKKIEEQLGALRQAGFEVDRLDRHYQQLGRTIRGLQWQEAGRANIATGIQQGKEALGAAMKLAAVVAVPTKVSADFQAIVRDIAIKADVAGKPTQHVMVNGREEIHAGERDIAKGAIAASRDSGMARNEVAQAINALVGAGMDLDKSLAFAPLMAKFSIGQASSGKETAGMVKALEQNAKISDPKMMGKAMESIAYLGKAGSFESSDMARWFPELLAEMQKLGITGLDSVNQLGAMLQVQMLTAGTTDEAANNLKNWFSKIGAEETKKQYKDAGVDYEAKMREAIGKGWSTMEASFVLARAYIEKVDPARAKLLAREATKISQESDPAKQKAMMAAFAQSMKTGDLFRDMQVKSALTAYMQNVDKYRQLKGEAAGAKGQIDKDLGDRRDASQQRWSEVGQSWNDAMRSAGDALRPITDSVATGLHKLGDALNWIATNAPVAVDILGGLAATFVAWKGAQAAWHVGKGVAQLAGGAVLGRLGKRLPGRLGQLAEAAAGAAGVGGAQRVFVVNWPTGGGLGIDPGGAGGPAAEAGKKGVLGRTWQALKKGGAWAAGGAASLLTAGRLVLAAPTLGTIGSMGAGGIATAGGMVTASGAVGYGAGTLANWGINKGFKAGTGQQDATMGGWLYDRFHRDELAKLAKPISLDDVNRERAKEGRAPLESLPGKAAPQATAPAQAAPAVQEHTFSPTLHITVQGDVKDPRQLATELMPHLQRLFDDYRAGRGRSAMFDSAHL